MALFIRDETPADNEAVRSVNRLAFDQEAEARLVDALRNGGFARLSLVAEEEGQVVGHVFFSDLPITAEGGTVAALALAPMAVLPELQRQGVGSALVRRALDICRGAEPPHRRRPGPPKLLSAVRVLICPGRTSGCPLLR